MGTEPKCHYYDKFYESSEEPWNYSYRGAEIYRHKKIPLVLAQRFKKFSKVLDIGCSLGQLTKGLTEISQDLYAMDVSRKAVSEAKKNCTPSSAKFLVGSFPGLPFLPNSFDLMIAADALHEFVPKENRPLAIKEILFLLKDGGICLFCDYLKPLDNRIFLDLIRNCGFKIIDTIPLNDRLWYSFESWFKMIRHWGWIRKILSSLTLTRLWTVPARLLGESGSRHVLILAQKGNV